MIIIMSKIKYLKLSLLLLSLVYSYSLLAYLFLTVLPKNKRSIKL